MLALALLASAALATSAVASTRVYVKPDSGKPTTNFVVRFRAPERTGSFGLIRSHYELYASGPNGKRCMSSVSIALGATKRGAEIRAVLSPKRLGGVWCAGEFRGEITEIETIVCERLRACPDIAIAPRLIARFSFRVRKVKTGSGGTQTTGPTFSGLLSATTCSALTPTLEPQERTYGLTWKAATDPVTPSSGIVYEIFYSSTPGGENFSKPSWTSPAGATTYSAAIRASGPAYFVVRARDQAGLEDHNKVERAGVDECLTPYPQGSAD